MKWNPFYEPTHVIEGYPMSKLNGLRCQMRYLVTNNNALVKLEKKVSRLGGVRRRNIVIGTQYLQPI